MARVAFLGLGNMGAGMAGRLVEAGHTLSVWNRTPAKAEPLVARGAHLAATPRVAADGAEAVLAMLADDEASRTVWLGPNGVRHAALAPSALAIECSTLSHDWVLELAGEMRAKGLSYIDCPVTGLPDAAAAGKLILLAGASDADLAAARPILAPLSSEIIHFGGVGAGTAYKLIVNLMGAVQIAGAAEGMALAERAGLEPAMVAAAIAKGQAASPQVVRNTARFVADDHDYNIVFSGRLRLKDVSYAMALARKLGLGAPFGEAAMRQYAALVERGEGDANESKVIAVARRP
jgi:3-hydroxyisobutyrate dehydrogenase